MRNLILFVVIGMLASCVAREKLVVNSWKFNGVELENDRDSTRQAFAAMASAQMKANINIKMDADSSYTIMQLKEGTALHGKWWFSADKKVLFTKTDVGLNQYKILTLTKNKLVYEVKDASSGQLLKMSCAAIAR